MLTVWYYLCLSAERVKRYSGKRVTRHVGRLTLLTRLLMRTKPCVGSKANTQPGDRGLLTDLPWSRGLGCCHASKALG
jgi:hypothetical protein